MSNGPKGLGEDEEADVLDRSMESPVIASLYSSDHQPYSSDVLRRFFSFACRLRVTIAHLFSRDLTSTAVVQTAFRCLAPATYHRAPLPTLCAPPVFGLGPPALASRRRHAATSFSSAEKDIIIGGGERLVSRRRWRRRLGGVLMSHHYYSGWQRVGLDHLCALLHRMAIVVGVGVGGGG